MHMLNNGYTISGLVRVYLLVETLYRILSFHNLIFLSFWKYRGNKANFKLKYKWQNFVSYVTGIRIKPFLGWDLLIVTLPASACTQCIHIWTSQSRHRKFYVCMYVSIYVCVIINLYMNVYLYMCTKAWRALIIWEGMGKHGGSQGGKGE